MDQVIFVNHAGSRKSGRFYIHYRPVSNSVLHELLNNGGFGNFVIVAEDQEIKISKELMEKHSPVLAAMLKTDCVESQKNKMKIDDFSFNVVKIIVKTMYSEKPPVDSSIENMGEVCRFVDKYDMKDLWKILEHWFEARLTFSTVCRIANIAHAYKLDDLYKKCVALIKDLQQFTREMDNINDLKNEVLRDIIFP
uniref:BTB domain-containing protein n=1 Tax=Panagrolaimus sp. JU765 TaxID=591449 RepID=A0AC34QQH5_9BILA